MTKKEIEELELEFFKLCYQDQLASFDDAQQIWQWIVFNFCRG